MRIAFQKQLLLNAFWQNLEDLEGLLGETLADEFILLIPGRKLIECLCLFASQQFIDLSNQRSEFRNEFNDSFRNNGNTEVHALLCSCGNRVCDVVSDLAERHLLRCNFFADEADIRLGFQSALQSDMGSRSAHNLDEVPVLLGRVCITLDVADQFGIRLRCSIETEGALDVVVLQVAVDSLRAADDLNTALVSSEVFRQHCGVRIRIITADDDNSGQSVLLCSCFCSLELLFCFNLRTTGTDDIESAGVAVCIDEGIIELYIFIINQSARASLETNQHIVTAGCLEGII